MHSKVTMSSVFDPFFTISLCWWAKFYNSFNLIWCRLSCATIFFDTVYNAKIMGFFQLKYPSRE